MEVKRKRGVAENLSVLLFIALVALSFVIVLKVLPRYISSYGEIARDVAFNWPSYGVATSGSLSRGDDGRLYLVLWNNEDYQVNVEYVIVCEVSGTYTTLAYGNVTLQPRNTVVIETTSTAPVGSTCFARIIEPGLVAYKILES